MSERIACPAAAARSDTDRATPEHILLAALGCAMAHHRNSRIIGNIRAGDLARAVRTALRSVVEREKMGAELRRLRRRVRIPPG